MRVDGIPGPTTLLWCPRFCRFEPKREPPILRFRWSGSESLVHAAGRPLFDSGSVWRLYEDGSGLQFDFSAPTMGTALYKRLFVDGQVPQGKTPDECRILCWMQGMRLLRWSIPWMNC